LIQSYRGSSLASVSGRCKDKRERTQGKRHEKNRFASWRQGDYHARLSVRSPGTLAICYRLGRGLTTGVDVFKKGTRRFGGVSERFDFS